MHDREDIRDILTCIYRRHISMIILSHPCLPPPTLKDVLYYTYTHIHPVAGKCPVKWSYSLPEYSDLAHTILPPSHTTLIFKILIPNWHPRPSNCAGTLTYLLCLLTPLLRHTPSSCTSTSPPSIYFRQATPSPLFPQLSDISRFSRTHIFIYRTMEVSSSSMFQLLMAGEVKPSST